MGQHEPRLVSPRVARRTETYNYGNMVHSYLNFEKICYDEICDTYRRMADFLQD